MFHSVTICPGVEDRPEVWRLSRPSRQSRFFVSLAIRFIRESIALTNNFLLYTVDELFLWVRSADPHGELVVFDTRTEERLRICTRTQVQSKLCIVLVSIADIILYNSMQVVKFSNKPAIYCLQLRWWDWSSVPHSSVAVCSWQTATSYHDISTASAPHHMFEPLSFLNNHVLGARQWR